MIGEDVVFDAAYSRDPDGEIVAYEWHLGPEIVQTGSRVVQSFSTPGPVVILLVVTDNQGATGRNDYVIQVQSPFGCGGGCSGGTCP